MKLKTKAGAFSAIFAAVLCFPSFSALAMETVPPDGPYRVGLIIEHAKLLGRETAIAVWYPAQPEPGAVTHTFPGGLAGTAVLNAPPDRSSAPYPLLIFSHGMGGCGAQSVYYTENLASHGYVVVAPDHKDSGMCHIDREADISFGQIAWAAVKGGGNLSKTVFALFGDEFEEMGYDFSYRPAEASETIDLALKWNRDSSHPLRGMMDPEKIGATGHSLGGFTTLMVGGVPFHCEGFQPDPQTCDTSRLTLRTGLNPCCMDYVRDLGRERGPFGMRDERVRAMLALGPAVFFPDLPRAASEIRIPLMIITGGHPRMEVPWEPIWTLYQNAPPPKYLIRLKKTDHMTISDTTLSASPLLVKTVLPGFRFGYKKKAQAYKDYSAAFFDAYLKGDESRAAVIKEPVNKFVEIWTEPE